jgi:hypothetical protein
MPGIRICLSLFFPLNVEARGLVIRIAYIQFKIMNLHPPGPENQLNNLETFRSRLIYNIVSCVSDCRRGLD